MFWKIIFGIYTIALLIFGWLTSGSNDHSNLVNVTNMDGLWVLIFLTVLYLFFTIFYSLARKIRTLNISGTKILIALTVFINLLMVLNPSVLSKASGLKILQLLAYIEIILLSAALLLTPIYVPLITYFKKYFTYSKELKNSFFNTYALFSIFVFVCPSFCKECYLLITGQVDGLLWKELISIACGLYVLLCYIGFVSRKNFLPKQILKITTIPVYIIYGLGLSLTEFKNELQEAINYPILINILVVTFIILEVLILYRYVYTDITSQKPDFIEVETVENKKEKLTTLIADEFKKKVFVSKWAYILWIFFLGGFGAHKFYAGKFRLGLIYILFYWSAIPGLISIAELILALFKTPNEYGDIEV